MPSNQYAQAIGQALPDWTKRAAPAKITLNGQYCSLVPLNTTRHGDDLYHAFNQAVDGRDWTYLPADAPTDRSHFNTFLEQLEHNPERIHYAIIDRSSNQAVGTLALMRVDTDNGSVEVGFVIYSPTLKKSRIATEAQFLLMCYVFDDLGYRRYEWKCDHLNTPSRAAALRLGFRFEGIFRNAVVYKGRNRDTAWYSMIDSEWATLRQAFTVWLQADNFDTAGTQYQRLSQLILTQPLEPV